MSVRVRFPSRAQKGSPLKSQKARLMKKAISRYLALAFLSVFFTACSSSDQVDIDDQPDYQAYGVYNKTTTLFSYTQYEDQWSVLTYETSYSFRIQNYDQKQVLTISSIPRTVQKGATYTIDVAVYGIDNILSLIHISEPTRLLSISYAVFCLKKKTSNTQITFTTQHHTYHQTLPT